MIDFDDKRPEATARRSFKSLTATARTFLARRPGVVCVFLPSAHGLAVQKRIEMPLGAHTHTHTRIGTKNYVLDGGPDPHEKGHFGEETSVA